VGLSIEQQRAVAVATARGRQANAAQQQQAPQAAPPDQQQSQNPPGFQMSEMASNVGPSALQFADDMTYPVRHPVKTYEGIKNLVQGVGDKAGFDWGKGDQSVYVDAVIGQLKERYGGVDQILQTLETDPVGLTSDVAGILMSGGSMTGIKTLNRLGSAIDPIQGAAKLVKTAAQPLARRLNPNDIYQEVMKFPTTASQGDRQKWAQTGLDEGITSGAQMDGKYAAKIDDINSELSRVIDEVGGGSQPIPIERVIAGLDELKREKGGFKVDASSDVAAIDKFRDDFLEQHWGRETVTPRQLQDFKVDVYDKINWKRRDTSAPQIDADIRTNVGRAAREGIEEALPEVKALNSELGKLLDARDPLLRSWNRIDNRNKTSILATLGAFAGGSTGPSGSVAGAVAGGVFGSLFRPEYKARLAVALNELAKNGGNAKLVDNALLKGLTNAQIQQLTKLSGRLGQLNDEETRRQAERNPQ
jgi:hypothetical protein